MKTLIDLRHNSLQKVDEEGKTIKIEEIIILVAETKYKLLEGEAATSGNISVEDFRFFINHDNIDQIIDTLQKIKEK